ESIVLKITAIPGKVGTITNKLTLATAELNPLRTNSTASATTMVTTNRLISLPLLVIADTTVIENTPPAGVVDALFQVTLSPASAQIVTVPYNTANGTAKAVVDYAATNGTLVFSPGQTTKTIAVHLLGDAAAEMSESFFVNLACPTNAFGARTLGTCTIMDDDPGGYNAGGDLAVSLSASAPSVAAAGQVTFIITVTNHSPTDVGLGCFCTHIMPPNSHLVSVSTPPAS